MAGVNAAASSSACGQLSELPITLERPADVQQLQAGYRAALVVLDGVTLGRLKRPRRLASGTDVQVQRVAAGVVVVVIELDAELADHHRSE